MNVLIRTDASFEIGTGHVMRCLTLAQALRERGAWCRFVCRAHPGHLIDKIRQQGFEVHVLPYHADWQPVEARPAHAAWQGADWATDAEETKLGAGGNESVPPGAESPRKLGAGGKENVPPGAESPRKLGAGGTAPDWLIIDHYGIDARWEAALRPFVKRILVIDDLEDRAHDCDLLLDQNLGHQTQDYANLAPHAQLLLGPRYALLRSEFAQWRTYSLGRRERPQLKRLLISMGGVDKDNVTGRVLAGLRHCDLPKDTEITVVLGKNAPWINAVKAQAEQLPWPTRVLVDVDNMAELLAQSDLAIGAAGSSAWERCCLGVPTVQVVLAENQASIHSALLTAGAVLPWSLSSSSFGAAQPLSLASIEQKTLRDISVAASRICDGQGVTRVADSMMRMHDENQPAV
ncbi:MAG: UDP-2,4-diacetamido-2,4,6-trideoxy-beta-L-altropyranose hydrolase [Pseudomonadota bacterium]